MSACKTTGSPEPVRLDRTKWKRLTLIIISGLLFLSDAQAASPPNVATIESLIEQARTQLNVKPDLAIELAKKSAAMASANLDGFQRDSYLSEADAVIGRALVRVRRIDDAEAIVRRGFARGRNGAIARKSVGELTLSSGRIHQYRDDVQAALGDYQKAYVIFRSVGEKRSQAVALQSIAKLYLDGGDSLNAIKYYRQSDEEYAGDSLMALSSRNNRGMAFLFLSQPADAEIQFKEALQIAEKVGSAKYATRILANIAEAEVGQRRFSEASETLDRAFASVGNAAAGNETWALYELRAQIAFARKDMKSATAFIGRALKGVDPATSDATYRQAHRTASLIYQAIGREKLAAMNLEAVLRLDEATAKLTATNSAALMAARFDFANQNTKIARLKAAELELQRNFLITVIAGGSVVLLLLTGGLILITRSRNRERSARLLLARTNTELEKAITAKMEFLATTSHEIRTPLNGILGMTQVMLSDRALGATLRDRIGIVHSAGETMRTLVDDILDVAKMETGKLAVGTGVVELKATLRQVAQVWRLQADAAGLDLVLSLDDCPELIEGDGGRIRQIVFNLLSNAMKFTERGKIELGAKPVGATDARRIHISIRDSGIGIAREWHESIFELFQQVDGGTTRKYGGTGLGLAICRNLARAMSGDITVESEPGFGSTFTIDLPLVEPIVGAARPIDSVRPNTALVIEHNPLTRGLMRAILSDRFELVAFVDGVAEAASFLALDQADWIVADASSVDDFVALFELTDVPVVLIEGGDPVPEAARARAHVVLPKPLTKAALLNVFAGSDVSIAVAA